MVLEENNSRITNNDMLYATSNISTTSLENGFYRYVRQVNAIPSLSKEEEFALATAYLEQHDLKAAHSLVASHLKLVVKIAINYKNYGLPVNDLVSEGNLGLMQAVKKYDPNLGFRLSTYAMWWIKAAIQEYILKSWSLVKIGTTAVRRKLFFSLNKIKNKLTNLYARQVSDNDMPEIASELGCDVSEVRCMNQRLTTPDISLNSNINSSNEEDSRELLELIAEPRANQETLLIMRQELDNSNKLLNKALNLLNKRELDILKERKLKTVPETLEKLSNKYQVSKERIRQIEENAFRKVQKFILHQAHLRQS